jgi:hypothetical protein
MLKYYIYWHFIEYTSRISQLNFIHNQLKGESKVSSFKDREFECSVCGEKSQQCVLDGTSRFGYYDLDFRPPRPYRDSMFMWIQECPSCGYCSRDISIPTMNAKNAISSKGYENREDFIIDSALKKQGNRTLRRLSNYIKIAQLDEKNEEAFLGYLFSAWVCDDYNCDELAINMRLGALEMLDMVMLADRAHLEKPLYWNYHCIKIDLLRRVGEFTEAKHEIEKGTSSDSDESLKIILMYQNYLCDSHDSRKYTFEDVRKYINFNGKNQIELELFLDMRYGLFK